MMHDPDSEDGPKRPARFVPVLHDDVKEDFLGIVLVRNHAEKVGEIEPGLPVWILEMAFAEDARERYDWMLTRPERWAVWARLAPIVGPEMLTLMMEDEQDEDVRLSTELQAQAERLARDARTVTALQTEVAGRPCVTLGRGSETEPFLVMAFDETVERDRLWDWIRWQPHRYRDWRMLWNQKGREPSSASSRNPCSTTNTASERRARRLADLARSDCGEVAGIRGPPRIRPRTTERCDREPPPSSRFALGPGRKHEGAAAVRADA